MKKPKPKCPICATDENLKLWLRHEAFDDPGFDAIDERNIAEIDKRNRAAVKAMSSDEAAIEAAERGEITYLRRRHPLLAKFLHLPSDLKVSPDKKLLRTDPTAVAVDVSPSAAAVWKRHRKSTDYKHRKLDVEHIVRLLAEVFDTEPETTWSRFHNRSYFSRK